VISQKVNSQKLIEKAEAIADRPEALVLLAGVSIAESALLPLPVDAVSMPIMALSKRRIPLVVAVGTASSVVGGLLGYVIGAAFLSLLGMPLLEWLGQVDAYTAVQAQMNADLGTGAWWILVGAITPLPFKFVCWAAGALQFPLWLFLILGVGGRFVRFAAIGALFWWFGPLFLSVLKRHAIATGIIMALMIAAGFIAIPMVVKS
jgi:membrane protein YqaA with SNARE-associated domain